jgi:GDP-4-dehydro-6-deoxy-D-mannose reductase
LLATIEGAEVIPTSRLGGQDPRLGAVERLDVNQEDAVERFIEQTAPTHVIHLAGWAAVVAAGANPYATWYTHLYGTLNVANAIMSKAPECVLLYVGTGQVYGATAQSGEPLSEASLLAPSNTYTASKAAADLALGALVQSGLRCVRLRPFNHTGRGQTEKFVVPSFAFQIARIKLGIQPPILHVGNLLAERDFLDVRDVVAAYVQALRLSNSLPPGCILNIASGKAYSVQSILDRLIEYSETTVAIESAESRVRSGEIQKFVGNPAKAISLLGWSPQHSFDETLRSVFDWAMEITRQEYPGRNYA